MSQLIRLVELALASLMLGMVVMVFGNVVLRYGFNSGITVSEELSRVFFVWLTFIGAILAMYEGAHLGVTNVVERMTRRGKLISAGICQVLIIACSVMLVWGTWSQHEINATARAPVTALPLIWVFGVGYLTGILITVHAIHRLWRIVTGQVTDEELIEVIEEDSVVPPMQQAPEKKA